MRRPWEFDTRFSVILDGSTKSYHLPSENYKLNTVLFSISGCWPFDSYKRRFILSTLYQLFMIGILFIEIMEILIASERSIVSMIEISMYILPSLCSMNGYRSLSNNIEKFGIYINQIKEFWAMLETEDEIRMLEDGVIAVKTYTTILLGFILLLVFAVIIQNTLPFFLDIFVPLDVRRSRKILIPAFIPFDEEKYYYVVYFLFFTTLMILSLMSISTYSCSIITSGHVITSLDTIGHILADAFETTKGIEIEKKFIRGIKMHKKVLQFVESTNENWEYTYLIQVLLGALISIFDWIHILDLQSSEASTKKKIVYLIYAGTTALCLWSACHCGQRMLNGSAKFYNAICTLPWYEYPIRTQKLFLFVILRSKKDCCLAVGKTSTMSYELFTSIFQTALSVAMLIRSLR